MLMKVLPYAVLFYHKNFKTFTLKYKTFKLINFARFHCALSNMTLYYFIKTHLLLELPSISIKSLCDHPLLNFGKSSSPNEKAPRHVKTHLHFIVC